jgi:preprotein translocase subunit SecE
MGETTGTKKGSFISNFVKGLKAEFKKIIWPNQETVTKETVSVVIVTVILGAVIAVLDFIIKWGLSFII